MKSRLLRKVSCDRCEVVEVQAFGGQVIRRIRQPCRAHRSTRP